MRLSLELDLSLLAVMALLPIIRVTILGLLTLLLTLASVIGVRNSLALLVLISHPLA